jgi:hypothetical protein
MMGVLVPTAEPTVTRFEAELDMGVSLKKLIHRLNCVVGNTNIIPNLSWPLGGVVRTKLLLLQFPGDISAKKAAGEIKGMKLNPGTLAEQLWLCLKCPEVIIPFSPIIAPGSVWTGRSEIQLVPSFSGGTHGKALDLKEFGTRQRPNVRFLASEPEP